MAYVPKSSGVVSLQEEIALLKDENVKKDNEINELKQKVSYIDKDMDEFLKRFEDTMWHYYEDEKKHKRVFYTKLVLDILFWGLIVVSLVK